VAYLGTRALRAEEKVARGGWAEDARRPARDQVFFFANENVPKRKLANLIGLME